APPEAKKDPEKSGLASLANPKGAAAPESVEQATAKPPPPMSPQQPAPGTPPIAAASPPASSTPPPARERHTLLLIGGRALGIRVKSGWATAVLVTGSIRSPQALARCRIDLCDPSVPGSSQPFHARMGTLQTDEAKVKRLRQVIIRATSQSVTELIAGYRRAG